MDPLSITASVLTLTAAATEGLKRLQIICDAPQEIGALANDIADLRTVVYEVAKALQERSAFNKTTHHSSETLANLLGILTRANESLAALDEILNKKLIVENESGKVKYARIAWLKQKPKVESIRKDLERIKLSLVTVWGASNSTDILRICLKLEDITLEAASNQDQAKRREVIRIQEFADDGSECNATSRSEPLHNRNTDSNHHALLGGRTSLQTSAEQAIFQAVQADPSSTLQIRASKSSCPKWCSCSCHKPGRIGLPYGLSSVLGTLSIWYTGLPLISRPCDQKLCQPKNASHTRITYQFPSWLLMRALSVMISSTASGPEMLLRTLRVLPSDAEIFRLAMVGDVEGIKSMFIKGQASVHDVDGRRWSLLHVRISGCQVLYAHKLTIS
ncbi:hypothetical protein GP486_000846 [Trichoglossum hirsutum]|uniref:Fungal N-terminal domain-containing protein n=1 Tax=Trichoglossum hirsutum TaxID=265104 RepID=A0A9P8LI96_9PEZI|nr:hypothetical protein GP486_000846 [Trichoglossum hirsutum]